MSEGARWYREVAALAVLVFAGCDATVTSDDGVIQVRNASSPAASAPYGINAHRPTGDLANQLFDKVSAAGISWVRIDVVWEDIETQRGVFDWNEADQSIQAARDRGLHVFANLHMTPRWANGDRPGTVPPTDAADWKAFCREVALRYDGNHGLPKVDVFGMWNEPDGSSFGESGDSVDKKLDKYIELILVPGYQAIHDARSDARVAAPDLAAIDSDFLTKMLDRAKSSVDIITVHKYSDYASGVTDAAERVRSIMKAAGVFGSKPLWLTETGWSTSGCDSVSDDTQAQRYTELLERLKDRPWVEKVFFYELTDDDHSGVCKWGVLRGDRSEKPAYRAYRDFISAHSSGGATPWAAVNSPNSNGNDFAHVDGDQIGGTFARSSTPRYFVNTGWSRSFRRSETISFSGEVVLSNRDFDGTFFVGFVDKNDTAAPLSLVGLTFNEPSGGSGDPFRARASIRHSHGASDDSDVFALSQNSTHTFSATWTGRADGSGTLSGEVDGTAFGVSQGPGDESLNAFGIGVGLDSSTVSNRNTGATSFRKLKFSVP